MKVVRPLREKNNMRQDTISLHKLIVLYLLSKADFPLTMAQVSTFMLERDYTVFMILQDVLTQLRESALIQTKTVGHRSFLHLTAEGREVLSHFEYQINGEIREEIRHYLREHELKLLNEQAILSDIRKTPFGEYEASLTVKEAERKMLEMTLTVPVKELAATVCLNWEKKNEEIYQYLLMKLLGDDTS
ncbi:MAG: DUF4364 family protein [Clostridium sp.]|nr:DUF4364 family protein [Clostridium sp.]